MYRATHTGLCRDMDYVLPKEHMKSAMVGLFNKIHNNTVDECCVAFVCNSISHSSIGEHEYLWTNTQASAGPSSAHALL